MQGRLSPPRNGRPQAFPWHTWQDEFASAQACGFANLEWLVTAERVADNPICSAAGVDDIRRHARASNLRVTSLCADCFITRPFVRVPAGEQQASVDLLTLLIERSAALGIAVLIVPLLETGAISDQNEALAVAEGWRVPLARAAALGVRVAIESDWPGERLRDWLYSFDTPVVGVCYDIGNAAALGYDAGADVRALADVLCAVHIKDRRRSGASVGLGQGDADLPGFVAALAATGFTGPLILETPAGVDPLAAARRHREFMDTLLRSPAAPR